MGKPKKMAETTNGKKKSKESKNTKKCQAKKEKKTIALYNYAVGDLVFTKVRGFPFWPGIVAEVTKTTITTNFIDYAKTW